MYDRYFISAELSTSRLYKSISNAGSSLGFRLSYLSQQGFDRLLFFFVVFCQVDECPRYTNDGVLYQLINELIAGLVEEAICRPSACILL